MIVKYFDLNKNLNKDINFYLFYGPNLGLIEETIDNLFKKKFPKYAMHYDEIDILSNVNSFEDSVFNKSFFDNEKLIIINRSTDKILDLIKNILDSEINDIKIILKSGVLEKKSKLRNLFEKHKKAYAVAFYEDNHQTLNSIVTNYFNAKKIKISSETTNFLIEKTKGNRINLKNELDKIGNYSHNKTFIELDEIKKITNSSENYHVSELADQCLSKNIKKTLNILNENISSNEEGILILKNFLYKLKRLKKLQENLINENNFDIVISSYKPPIFWKEKEIVKRQLKVRSLNEIRFLIKKVNNLENIVKKNSHLSKLIINNFILESLEIANN